MENVIRFHQTLAAEELPAKIAAVQSAGSEEIAQSAESLQSMGAYALPALPALRAKLAEISREQRYDPLVGIRLKSAIDSIASAGMQSERKLQPAGTARIMRRTQGKRSFGGRVPGTGLTCL